MKKRIINVVVIYYSNDYKRTYESERNYKDIAESCD